MPIFIFFSSLLLYLSTLAPSITVGDSGEFCASSMILGLPHSPGYPLYCLLGKIFTLLIPFGSYAFRVNIMSALFASFCLALLYQVLLAVSENKESGYITSISLDRGRTEKAVALFAVALLGVSGAFWHSAIQSEVFTLNALFVTALLYFFIEERYYLGAFVFGLGLGNHHTLIFLGPLFIIAALQKKLFKPKPLLMLIVLFLIGFSVYLYLPIRSSKNPALDWGHPETLHNLWRVISRADYGSLSLSVGEKVPRNLTTTFQQLFRFFKVLSVEFTWLGVLAGILGWFIAIKEKYNFSRTLLFLCLLTGPFFILLSNMSFDSQSEGILERFYVMLNVFWVFPMMWGVGYIIRECYLLVNKIMAKAGAQALFIGNKWVYVTAALLAVSLSALTVKLYPSSNWRNYYLEYDYGHNVLKTLSLRSVFFMDGGDDTFYSMSYFCFAERKRQDIELHDRGGLVFKNPYGKDFRNLSKEDKELRRNKVEKEFYLNKNIYYSTFNKEVLPGVKLIADGILYKPMVAPPKYKYVTAQPIGLNTWQMYSFRGVYDKEYYDYRSNALVPIYPFFGAYHNIDNLSFLKYTYRRWPDVLWTGSNIRYELINYAFQKFNANALDEAEAAYKKVLGLFPDEASAMINMGVISEKRNDIEGSKKRYRKALEISPGYPDAYYNLAVLYWKEKNWAEVIKNLKLLLEVKPGDQRAKYYLPMAIANQNKKYVNEGIKK